MQFNLYDRFLDEIDNVIDSTVNDQHLYQAKRCLLDYLAATIAGSSISKKKSEVLLKSLGNDNDKSSTVIGMRIKASTQNAAFINGFNSHKAELDDGVLSGIIHPGGPIFSALLPVSEKQQTNGHKFLLGIIAGYEAAVRLSEAIQPSHKKQGFHATGTCGSIGATLAIAKILSFDRELTKRAVSASAVSCAGSLKALEDNSELKPFNVARASQSAIISTLIAQAEFEGPNDIFSGINGFLNNFSITNDQSKLFKDQDSKLAILKVYFKPHAACRYCHSPIEAALRLKNKYSIDPKTIKSILVETYSLAVEKHDHIEINNVSSAKMSIPYGVAIALIKGNANHSSYDAQLIDQTEIISLIRKVKVQAKNEFTLEFPKKSSASVEIITNKNQKFIEQVDEPKGGEENPLNDNELENKFRLICKSSSINEENCNELINCIWNIESRLNSLYRLLA